MHTVPKSYLELFAVSDPSRRTAGVNRFSRDTDRPKLIGIEDAEVVKDIYTIWGSDGTPDTVIEDSILLSVEGAFISAVKFLQAIPDFFSESFLAHAETQEHWKNIAHFVAIQMLRTPRYLTRMRAYLDAKGIAYGRDHPQRIMVEIMRRWVARIMQMNGIIAKNETSVPFITSDNPAMTWKRDSHSATLFIDHRDPAFAISCPLTPRLVFIAYQTPQSLTAILEGNERTNGPIRINVKFGPLPVGEVEFINTICAANAHKHVYASFDSPELQEFLLHTFRSPPTL